MNLNRMELLQSLSLVMPGINTGNVLLDGSDTFVFKDNYIYSYNDNLSITVPFEMEGLNGIVKAKEFYDLVNRLSENEIKIIEKDDTWVIKSGTAKATFKLLESNIFEYVEAIQKNNNEWKALPEKFIEGIELSILEGNRSVLSGIFIKDKYIYSTDEVRLSKYEMKDAMDLFWMSDNASMELVKFKDLVEYQVLSNWIQFKDKNNVVFSCRRLNSEKYPIDKIDEQIEINSKIDGDIEVTIPKGLLEAVDRASALSTSVEAFNAIKLVFTDNGIEVSGSRMSGEYKETVAVEGLQVENDVDIMIDAGMLMNGLKKAVSFYIHGNETDEGEQYRLVLNNENFQQVICTLQN